MPYWDHEGETQFLASPLRDSYNKGKMPGLSLRWTGLFSFMCPPPDCLKSLGESRKVCTPLQGRQRILNPHWGVLLLLRQSPPPQVSARVFSGRISGVCLQWCIRCASQVFACKGIFRVHLRCLPAKVYSVRISGVCN